MDATRFSSIARPLDLKDKTNLIILILTIFTGVAGTFIKMPEGLTLLPSFLWGLSAAFMIFISWAISRELDPDYPYSAFVAVGLMGLAVIFVQKLSPDFLLLLFLLLLFRLINRSVGPPARVSDSLLILGLGIWLSLDISWIIAFIMAIAFWTDSSLPEPLNRQKIFGGISILAGSVILLVQPDQFIKGLYLQNYLIYDILIAASFIPVIWLTREVKSMKDLDETPLHSSRVRAAQILALLAFLVLIFWEGYSFLLEIMPMAAAFVGITLYRLTGLIFFKS